LVRRGSKPDRAEISTTDELITGVRVTGVRLVVTHFSGRAIEHEEFDHSAGLLVGIAAHDVVCAAGFASDERVKFLIQTIPGSDADRDLRERKRAELSCRNPLIHRGFHTIPNTHRDAQ
jgi:hypothetical protein